MTMKDAKQQKIQMETEKQINLKKTQQIQIVSGQKIKMEQITMEEKIQQEMEK